MSKVKIVPVEQVTLLLPLFTSSELEHVTSTTVPEFTGNCVVVSMVLVHPVFSSVQTPDSDVFIVLHRTSPYVLITHGVKDTLLIALNVKLPIRCVRYYQ